MPQNEQGKRSVGSGNVQIDSSMIEFTEQLFQLSRTTAVNAAVFSFAKPCAIPGKGQSGK